MSAWVVIIAVGLVSYDLVRVLAVGLALVDGARLAAMAFTADLTPLGAAIGRLP